MEVQNYDCLSPELLLRLEQLDHLAFEKPLSASVFEEALSGKPSLLLQLATLEGEDLAYKVGFAWYDGYTYFSFSGAVRPEFRRRGIARQLAREQHEWAKAHGFRYLRTHTKNKYRAMLLLNIAMGFDVAGFEHRPCAALPSIILTKAL